MGQEFTKSRPAADQEWARSAPGVGQERTESKPGEHHEWARSTQEWVLALTGGMGTDTWGLVSACWRAASASSSAFISSLGIPIILNSDLYMDVAAKAAQS